jgi:tetratricopeptide (TPR) repeat protein
LGFDAFDALVAAEEHEDPEIAMQAGYLVRQIRSGWTQDTDPRQIQEILKDYELQSDERRLVKIKELAALPDDAGLKWLCRLVRFEKSQQLSKQAALAIMGNPPADDLAWRRRAETIRAELKRTRRPAAQWLDVYLDAHRDPALALPRWSALAAAETQTLSEHPRDTHSQIVIALLKREVELLDGLGRTADTDPVLKQMVLAERGDSTSLSELIHWFVARKSWNMIDLVAERFAASFDVDAMLMYTLCEARLAQGKQDVADQLAQRALLIHGDNQQEHVLLANRLSDQGLPRWADREWLYAIELGPAGSQWDVAARKLMANSYHDRQEDGKAAALIAQLVEAAEKDTSIMQRLRTSQQQFEGGINSLRSDMFFYQACQAQAEQNSKEQRSLLDKSLEQNRQNIEALIALFQLVPADDPKREELRAASKEFIDMCREQIEDQPENPTFYNQIAWLVANTEGDFEEAVELSQKSVELAREQEDPPLRLGGLLDTLAHCYAAKGDYASAVKTQEEAMRLDPHTRSIRRALDEFREKLAEQKK